MYNFVFSRCAFDSQSHTHVARGGELHIVNCTSFLSRHIMTWTSAVIVLVSNYCMAHEHVFKQADLRRASC